MSTKQISKDNKEYWENKLNTKFNTKIKAIESMHLAEIREKAEKNFGSFTKTLQIEKDLKAVESAEKDFNTFFESIDKLLNAKRSKLREVSHKLETKLKDWASNRDWETTSYSGNDKIPSWDWDNKEKYSLTTDFYKFVETKCHEETKKAFYKTSKGEELKVISEAQEEAIDLLHSDMIGTEVLKHISAIAKRSKIAISIPQSDVKQLTN
jgi:hypothetical protein